MKETQLQTKDKIEILKQQKIQKQLFYKNSVQPHSGHKCFSYNTVTNVMKLAKFKEDVLCFLAARRGEIAPKRKVIIETDCIYITALNMTNAIKHIKKYLNRNISPIIDV